MKRMLIFLFATTMAISTAYGQTKPPEQAEITKLVNALTQLTEKADACGEHMNYFGKKALEGEVCKEFNKGYYELWPDRETLQQEVADYTTRLEQGEYQCEQCRSLLQRAEELRITVTYYLDYMDFVKEF